MRKCSPRRAFSLVELSIVLVILGLLVGGILGGKALIRASQLRTIVTQKDQWITAVNTFKGKYFMLPGDMNNAEQFWGTLDPVDATCKTTASTDTRTCNGDGDGQISATVRSHEILRAWQHLVSAGMIEGQYQGIFPATVDYTNILPPAKFGNVYWYLWTKGVQGASPGRFTIGDYGTALFIGTPSALWQMGGFGLTPTELWNIDTKLDDGKPITGKVVIVNTTAGTPMSLSACSTAVNNADYTADYLLTSENGDCTPAFRQLRF